MAASVRTYRVREGEGGGAVAAACTVSASWAVWASELYEPVKVTVAEEAEVFAATANVTCCGVPGVTFGPDGETVTPEGKPVTWIATGELKPLEGATVREIDAEEPAATVKLAGEGDRVKSGVGCVG